MPKGDLLVGTSGGLSYFSKGNVGEVLTVTSNTSTDIHWAPIPPAPLQNNYHFAKDASESSTTSTTYLQKLRLTTSSVPAGTYHIAYAWTWKYSLITADFKARCRVDSNTIVDEIIITPSSVAVNQQNIVSSFDNIVLGAGTHTVDIDYSSSDVLGTASIKNTKIELYKIG